MKTDPLNRAVVRNKRGQFGVSNATRKAQADAPRAAASASCKFFVEGMDLPCPVCNTLVKSGEAHECHR